ncbi:MAG TPA: hypothetical protein VHK63_05410, partial [Candidatus Limnocylindria bacterium]|nr:hypothetical protein [Candidatus Limnocylindria bacterium]
VSASASATQPASLTPPPTTNPSVEGTPTPKPSAPTTALETGQVGYLQVDGQPQREIRLSFVNDATGTLTRLGPTGGPPVVAALSPTNEFLAYAVDLGLSGARQVRVTRLSDGATTVLGCTVPRAFADRLAWSDDGRWLAYTLTPIDLGGSVDCGGVTGDGTRSDVWVYDAVATGEAIALTRAGNAFAADFVASNQQDGEYPVLISYAGEEPYTEAYSFITDRPQPRRVEGVFLPLMSADGTRALFWRGRMEQVADGGWHFVDGGLPYLSGEPVDGQPSWSGEPLFADLEPVGGAAFESGQFGWSPDGMLVGFWLGEWTGAPQSGDGSYPSPRDVYVGRAGDLLSAQSRVPLELQEQQRVVDVALDGESETALVTVVQPSAGDLAVPASTLYRVPVAGGEPAILGTAASWTGPAVIGLEAVADTR